MADKHIGKQTVALQNPPAIAAGACVVGKKEGEGPLRDCFDYISEDSYFGESSWEKAESAMFKQCFSLVCDKAKIAPSSLQYIFSGDLLNQCTGSTFALRDSDVPFFGLYGACSTMAESLALAAMTIDGGFADTVCAISGSHFCSSERQFRLPLEYGGQRTPTAQWTVTGCGGIILKAQGKGPKITHITTGKIVDAGVKDAANMGAAMAPAAIDTLIRFFEQSETSPEDYDAIFAGDLGYEGSIILKELMSTEGYDMSINYEDCGNIIFDRERQDVHSGGSGCGCSAVVLASYILPKIQSGEYKKVLMIGTGAMMSPSSLKQGLSIPAIAHLVMLEHTEAQNGNN